ncbi:MAG: MFS transporter, partial [Trebonia sp.]
MSGPGLALGPGAIPTYASEPRAPTLVSERVRLPARPRMLPGGPGALLAGLPEPVWVLEVGSLINALGGGFVLPFAVIYLHNVRGFALGESAAVVAVISVVGVVSGPLAGTAADRWSARAVLAASLALMAIGFVGFPFVRAPWQAFGLAIVAGTGNGSFYPSQSYLISGLVGAAQR